MTRLPRADRFGLGAIVALALLLWAPRLSGPIDLRYDAGVYYLLGTSLASGDGYRLPNEPGAPEAVQYPPLLPALVACHQVALGTSDVEVVAPWLRRTYALLFLCYAALTYALARVYLAPLAATAATTTAVASSLARVVIFIFRSKGATSRYRVGFSWTCRIKQPQVA